MFPIFRDIEPDTRVDEQLKHAPIYDGALRLPSLKVSFHITVSGDRGAEGRCSRLVIADDALPFGVASELGKMAAEAVVEAYSRSLCSSVRIASSISFAALKFYQPTHNRGIISKTIASCFSSKNATETAGSDSRDVLRYGDFIVWFAVRFERAPARYN